MTVKQFLETGSAVAGQRSRLVTLEAHEFVGVVEQSGPSFGKEFADNFRYHRDSTYTGGDDRVKRPADVDVAGVALTSYRQYLGGLDVDSSGVKSWSPVKDYGSAPRMPTIIAGIVTKSSLCSIKGTTPNFQFSIKTCTFSNEIGTREGSCCS